MSISQGRSAFSFLKTGLLASVLALSAQSVIAQDYVMKISIGDAPLPEDVEHYNQTGLRNFETDLEELSGGRIDVQIFWNGQLGKVENVLNLVRNGQVEGVIASDGHVAPYYPDSLLTGKLRMTCLMVNSGHIWPTRWPMSPVSGRCHGWRTVGIATIPPTRRWRRSRTWRD